MKDEMIIQFASQFRKGLLNNNISQGMCFAVCVPLQSLLSIGGIETELKIVDFKNNNHAFLIFNDGRILDPTADQFPASGLPAVYLGSMPDCYTAWMQESISEVF